MSRTWLTSLAAILSLGCLQAQAGAQTTTPFSGDILALATTRTVNPTVDSQSITGSGVSTGLGQFAVVAEEILDFNTSTSALGFGFGIFVTGDGDQIYYVQSGSGTLESGDVLLFSFKATILGGTGAFAKGRGSFTIEGTIDLTSGEISADIDGTITVP